MPGAGGFVSNVNAGGRFKAQSETDTKRDLLIVPLANTPASVMTAFLQQLASGHELHVGAGEETQTFDLSGSSPALDAFGRCIAAMSSNGD